LDIVKRWGFWLGLVAVVSAVLWCITGAGTDCRFLAKHQIARSDLQALGSALDRFAQDHDGVYPMALVDVLAPPNAELDPAARLRWACMDPWGKPYTYQRTGVGRSFRLQSFGSDRQLGGSGDGEDLILDSEVRER